MLLYAKVDRATGVIIKRKYFDGIKRNLKKPQVWLEIQQNTPPLYDSDNEKLVSSVTQPDLSDLNIPVDPLVKRVQGYNVVALTTQEKQKVIDNKINNTNHQLFRLMEMLMVQIATGTDRLKRTDFPANVWTKINARRALRGESPI